MATFSKDDLQALKDTKPAPKALPVDEAQLPQPQSAPGAAPGVPANDPGSIAARLPKATPANSPLPKIKFRTLNSLILEVIKTMPTGGGYGISMDRLTAAISIDVKRKDITIKPEKASPTFCSAATYLVLLRAVGVLLEENRLNLPNEAIAALAVARQPDGVGVWGRWNANGPGTAKLFQDLGIGINFVGFEQAQPGDFLKLWWTDEIGSKEHGHSVIYLGLADGDKGEKLVRFWSANQGLGYSEKALPMSKIGRALFSRLENPSLLSAAPTLAKKDNYLADMLKRPSTEKEMFTVCGVNAPAGASIVTPRSAAPEPEAAPPGATPPAPPVAPPAPGLAQIFAGSPYAAYNKYAQGQILRMTQEYLKAEGSYQGVADGIPGPRTNHAIQAWQTKVGIEPNGLLGNEALKRMSLDGIAEAIPEPPAAKGKPTTVPQLAIPTESILPPSQ